MTGPLLATMIDAAIEAGAIINAIYDGAPTARAKADGSPVTEADEAAEAAILARLAPLDIPVLGEESAAAGRIPLLGRRYFIVDPLDGTKEFIKRNGEFTVNIALAEDGRPTHGVVLAPATGAIFVGGPEGAFEARLADGAMADRRALRVAQSGPIRVVASRSHGHEALTRLCAHCDVTEDVSVGSSLKFCLLARGEARLYPRFTPTCEWDTAAGQAVLEAAGGLVLTLEGKPLAYGKDRESFLNPFFVAASDAPLATRAAHEMVRLLA